MASAAAAAEGDRLIFLDSDGVLANGRSHVLDAEELGSSGALWDELVVASEPDADGDWPPPLERLCLANLLRLAAATRALVVLSTSWRLPVCAALRQYLVAQLQTLGVEVVGDTPDLGGEGRGAEVSAFLRDYTRDFGRTVAAFVILDDNHRESFEQHGFGEQFVETLMMGGDAYVGKH